MAFAICMEYRRRSRPSGHPLVAAGQTLFMPSLDLGILAGITRAVLADLAAADEVFLSSSTRGVMPLVAPSAPTHHRLATGDPGRSPVA